MLPFWLAAISGRVMEQEAISHDSYEALVVGSIWPTALVLSGIIGFAGLVRVLTLPRDRRPESTRVLTVAMVAIGLTALAIFDLSIVVGTLSDLSAGIPVAGIVIYIVLPFAGAAWLMSQSWRYLFAGPGR